MDNTPHTHRAHTGAPSLLAIKYTQHPTFAQITYRLIEDSPAPSAQLPKTRLSAVTLLQAPRGYGRPTSTRDTTLTSPFQHLTVQYRDLFTPTHSTRQRLLLMIAKNTHIQHHRHQTPGKRHRTTHKVGQIANVGFLTPQHTLPDKKSATEVRASFAA